MGCAASSESPQQQQQSERDSIAFGSEREEEGNSWKNTSGTRFVVTNFDESTSVEMLGAGSDPEALRRVMKEGRQDIRHAQEKLTSSMTTSIVEGEQKVLNSGSWLREKKDVQRRYQVLPPISAEKRVGEKHMSFYID